MVFQVDPRIEQSAAHVFSGPLCEFYLNHDERFYWFILVPRVAKMTEIYQLEPGHQMQLMREISELSKIMQSLFKPDKLNVAALGNLVSQLHVHVVARFASDPLWPQGIWQQAQSQGFKPRQLEQTQHLMDEIRPKLHAIFA